MPAAGFSQQADFSGTWKLKEKEADPGHANSLAPLALVLEQAENSLSLEKKIRWEGNEITSNEKYTLDGKECKNPPDADQAKISTAEWEQDHTVLKITSFVPLDYRERAKIVEKYKMQGTLLIIESTATSPDGELAEKFILERQ